MTGIYFVLGIAVLATAQQACLPGSELSVDAAVSDTQIIAVSQAPNVGLPIIAGSAGVTYGSVDLHPSRSLKGGALPHKLRLESFLVRTFLDRPNEIPPSEGKDYIFFIKQLSPSRLQGIKILTLTPENLALVTAALKRESRLPKNHLPGSRLSHEEATRRSQIIVVSKGDRCVDPDMGFPVSGGRSYKLRIEPSRYLKGKQTSEVLQIHYMKCSTFTEKSFETLPDYNKEYIFFINKERPTYQECIKVVPATPKALSDLEKKLSN